MTDVSPHPPKKKKKNPVWEPPLSDAAHSGFDATRGHDVR